MDKNLNIANLVDNKKVILNAKAYSTILLYASRFANSAIPQREWKHVYGILIGYYTPDFINIEQAEPLIYVHPEDVIFNEDHFYVINKIKKNIAKVHPDYKIVGWFHSHPGKELNFTFSDLINQLTFQTKNSDFCGLVFDHELLGRKREEKIKSNVLTKYDSGFEIYRLRDVKATPNMAEFKNNYQKIDYIIKGLDKFFFANTLTELSFLASEGRPLQMAFGELEKMKKRK